MIGALEEDRAVIVFPAGEVSRAGPAGVRDGKWLSGFLHAARRTNAPILPVHVGGRNSSRFYSLSSMRGPLGTLMLPSEMFRQRDRQIPLRVGGLIPLARFDRDDLTTPVKLKLLRKHVYRLGRGRKGVFVSETGIARPENRQRLREELREARCLGETADGKRILLFDSRPDSAVMREIGRLREITFRRVGEGTGNKRDLDDFDNHYRHLILWDDQDLEIAGATGSARSARFSIGWACRGFTARRSSSSSRHPGRSGVMAWSWGEASCSHATGGAAAGLSLGWPRCLPARAP